MILPSGTIGALKGNGDAIVCVVVTVLSLSALSVGAPWIGVVAVTVGMLVFYYLRRGQAEKHELAVLGAKLDEAILKVDMVKARYRDFHAVAQPELPLGAGRKTRRKRV